MIENIFAILDWCKVAIFLGNKNKRILFKEGEIWWCSIGMNIGVEIFGKGFRFTRPVMIFKKFNADLFWGIPLTSQPKDGLWYLPIHCASLEESYAILNQVRSFDAKRLIERMATLTDNEFAAVKQKFFEICRPTSGEAGNPNNFILALLEWLSMVFH